jgi:hypothetical protein
LGMMGTGGTIETEGTKRAVLIVPRWTSILTGCGPEALLSL